MFVIVKNAALIPVVARLRACPAPDPALVFSFSASRKGQQHPSVGALATPVLHVLVFGDGVAEERGYHGVDLPSQAVRGRDRIIRGGVWGSREYHHTICNVYDMGRK